METTKYCDDPRHSVHRGSLALGGPQTDSSSVPGRVLVAKAAPEQLHELSPIGPNMRARGSPRRLLAILAERGLDCEEKSATTVLAVCLLRACSATRWLGRR